MTSAPATHGPPRQACARCEGLKTTSPTGPRCPRCKGSGFEPVPRPFPRPPAQPRDPETAASLLAQLRVVGLRRKEWATARTPDAVERREEIRQEIVRLHDAARAVGVPVEDVAAELDLSRQRLHMIVHGLGKGERRWQ